jgi:hypothetical protein
MTDEVQPVEAESIEFRFTPSVWMTYESALRLAVDGGNCKGAVPVHSKRSATSTIPLYDQATLDAAFSAGRDEEPMDMALCERHYLVLRVGVPYIFRPVGDCEKCAEMVEKAREAYGDDLGA